MHVYFTDIKRGTIWLLATNWDAHPSKTRFSFIKPQGEDLAILRGGIEMSQVLNPMFWFNSNPAKYNP